MGIKPLTKKLVIVLAIFVGVSALIILPAVILPHVSVATYCSDGWQQRRLGELYSKQETTIYNAESIVKSTKLLSDYPDGEARRFDNQASGDCIDGQPASVAFSKQITVSGHVTEIYEKVAASLKSQGFTIDEYQMGQTCGTLGPHATASKDGVKFGIRVSHQAITCSGSNSSNEALNLQAESVYMGTSITLLGSRI